MLDIVVAVLGWALVAVVVADVFRTVLWSGQGGGPITGLVTTVLKSAMTPLARRSRLALSALGPVALLAIATAWAALLVGGYTLALQADPDAIESASTGLPAGWSERAYAVGFSVFTLGTGDFVPANGFGQAMFVVMSATGLFLMTLSVTYLLPVVAASVQSRAFAGSVLSTGGSAAETVVTAWDGERVALDHQLRQWQEQIATLAHQHLAYPVLHLFHSADRESSSPAAVARVDEVLTLLDAVEVSAAPSRIERRQLRFSIDRYVRSFGEQASGDRPAPPADLGLLRAAGIPLRATDEDFEEILEALEDHRARVHEVAERARSDGS